MKYLKKFENNLKYKKGDYVLVEYVNSTVSVAKITGQMQVGQFDYHVDLPNGYTDEIFQDYIKRYANNTEIEIFHIEKGDVFLVDNEDNEVLMKFIRIEADYDDFIYEFNYDGKIYEVDLNDIIRKATPLESDTIKYNL